MRRALALAAERAGETAPNPAVGCVLVREGRVVGEAATAAGGRPHAEEQALAIAGGQAAGSTAYVTLEPCGARSTPGAVSCAERLAAAGVARVVVGAADPSPFASGRGPERLAAAGVALSDGVLRSEAEALVHDWLRSHAPRPPPVEGPR